MIDGQTRVWNSELPIRYFSLVLHSLHSPRLGDGHITEMTASTFLVTIAFCQEDMPSSYFLTTVH